jgi:hypothetical protein
MYVIDLNDPVHQAGQMPEIYNAIYTTYDRAREALIANGFITTPQLGNEAYTKGDIIAVISRCPVNPILGKEEVQLR